MAIEDKEPKSAREVYDLLLASLRRAGMGWIADQILVETQLGEELQIVEKSGKGEISGRALSSEESLSLAISIIDEYVRVPDAIWNESTAYLLEKLKIGAVSLLDGDTEKAFVPFLDGFASALQALQAVLNEIVKQYDLEVWEEFHIGWLQEGLSKTLGRWKNEFKSE